MTAFYLITLGGVGACIFGAGYYVGRIVEHRHNRTRGVTLSEFRDLTRSR